MTFTVTVRDHLMIAHSFSGAVFGPAQRLHGATFVADAAFSASELDDDGIVIDIGWAAGALADVVGALTYRNLDEEPAFAGINSTTERLCQVIADRLVDALPESHRIESVAVTLHESHIAWASFTRSL